MLNRAILLVVPERLNILVDVAVQKDLAWRSGGPDRC
jgi:hypothetical protein